MPDDSLRGAEVLRILALAAKRFEGFYLRTDTVEIDLREPVPAEPPQAAEQVLIRSTCVGTLRGLSVRDGDGVEATTTLCCIDVLGTPQEVAAGIDGVVTRVLSGDGEPVEFGQPLVAIAPVTR